MKFTPLLFLLLSPLLCFAQWNMQVLDEQAEPLIGAYVRMQVPAQDQPSLNAATDLEGNVSFSDDQLQRLTALGNELQLTVTYIGYTRSSQTLLVTGGKVQSVTQLSLKPAISRLQEAEVLAVRARPSDPFAFTNVDAEPLAVANPGQDIPMMLRRTPGAVITSDAGSGIGYSGIRIRGADATRVNVTVNGVPLNDSESQGVFWVNMPDFISSTENLQIQRGVGESTHGSGSFGANINLITSTPSSDPKLTASLGGGSFGTGRAMLKASSGDLGNGLSAEVRGSYITSEGFVDRARARMGSVYLGTEWAINDRQRLQAIAWTGSEETYQAWYGIPLSFARDPEQQTYNPAGLKSDGTFYDDQTDNYRQTHAQLLYSHQLKNDFLLQLTGHYTKGRGYYEEWRNDQTLSDYFQYLEQVSIQTDLVRRLWLDNHFYGGIATISGQLSPKLDLTWSAGINEYRGAHFGTVPFLEQTVGSIGEPGDRRYYDNDAVKRDFNTFAKFNYALAKGVDLYADAQLRHVNYAFTGVDRNGRTLPQTVDFTFFNPKGGVSLKRKWGQLFGSFAVGQREPNRNDFQEAPPEQQPRAERLYNTEIGFRRSGGSRYTVEVNTYHMAYRDQLAVTGRLNDVGEATRINIDKSSRMGVEFAGAVALNKGFSVEGNLALSRSTIDRFEEYVDNWATGEQDVIVREGTPLAFSPQVVSNLGLLYARKLKQSNQLQLAIWGNGISEQFLDNSGSDIARLPAYARVDFEASYRIDQPGIPVSTFTFQVQNIANSNPVTNGWSYRFNSPGYDPRPDDPYAGQEQGDGYVLNGFFPQAGIQVLGGIQIELGGKR
ncbi:MAG: TonB-dependent receptor plug domain-containing protein [Saprospiraceae bacterium]